MEEIKSNNTSFEANQKLAYAFLNKHYPRYAHDDDVVQETMIALWQASENYNVDMGTEFSTYSYRCMDSAVKDYLRREKKNTDIYIGLMGTDADAKIDYRDKCVNDEDARIALCDVLESVEKDLNAKEREIIDLTIADFSNEEIAEIIGTTEHTVRSTVYRAREKLRENN